MEPAVLNRDVIASPQSILSNDWVGGVMNTEQLRERNDHFRSRAREAPNGSVTVTLGIIMIHRRKGLLQAVISYDVFTNGPDDIHAFGKFIHEGHDCFWEITGENDELHLSIGLGLFQ